MLSYIVFLGLSTFISVKCYESSWSFSYNNHRIPQDIMVDVVNNFALKLLAVHNEGNENNIAISPYGALSVLVALAEGVRGSALYEIQRVSKIPSDVSVVRVGLRDIHRHLKSYFIPEEGFLSGLFLSHDNVSLNEDYEEILRFYGFDINSFNNVLYPDMSTTTNEMPLDTTQVNTELSTNAEIATQTSENAVTSGEQTTNAIDTSITITTEPTIMEDSIITSTELHTITTENEVISTFKTTTSSTSSDINSTSESTTVSLVSEDETLTTTDSINQMTNTVEDLSTSSNSEQSSNNAIQFESTSSIPETTTANSRDQFIMTSTIFDDKSTSENSASTTTSSPEQFLSTIQSQITTTTLPNKINENSIDQTTIDKTTSTLIESTTAAITTESITTEEMFKFTSTEIIDSTRMEDFSTAEVDQQKSESIKNDSNRRKKRSVVDYVIARYYDDHITQRPPPYYVGNDQYFLIDGKYKEYNINFMTYDTILPFHHLSHLNTLALRFPLDSSRYYLLLLLPQNPQDVNKLICDLRLNTNLKYIIDHLQYTHVKATIPSFMLKGLVVLTSTFQKMGIRKVFEPRQADFSLMTDDRRIYVTNIEQAITVNIRNYVDPTTINTNRYLQQLSAVDFKVDHPFLYFVIDSEIDVILMTGKIVNPLNSRIR